MTQREFVLKMEPGAENKYWTKKRSISTMAAISYAGIAYTRFVQRNRHQICRDIQNSGMKCVKI